MTKLPKEQALATAIDAVNHVNEAATTKVASPYVVDLARRTVELIKEYLPRVLENPEDLTARYWVLYASTIAGIALDNGLAHITHALEHPLSAIDANVTHGIGLAALMPAVVKYCHPALPKTFAYIYEPIVEDKERAEKDANYLAQEIEKWLFDLGLTQKLPDLGFKESDVDELTRLAMTTPSLDILLSLAPIEVNEDVVRNIYLDSMQPIQ